MTDSAIILCGGQSSRMGSDKAALPFGPDTLLTRVVRAARAVAGDVVIVGDTSQSMPAGVRVVSDPIPGLGPLAALATGLASVGAERSLLVACDMPLLVPAVLRRLLDLTGDADACVPRVHGMPMTTCAVYTARVLPRAQAQLAAGTRSLRALLDDVSVRWVSAEDLRDLDPGLLSFWDCDTPEHYRAALRQAGLLRAGTNASKNEPA
jgi:molybdenum cofactor guanylyltransferase